MAAYGDECRSEEALLDLDRGDVEAAIELGDRICREYGICYAEKGKLIYDIFQKMQEIKAGERERRE